MKFKSKPPSDVQLAKEHCAYWKTTCKECFAGIVRPEFALPYGCVYFIQAIAPLRKTETYRERYGDGVVLGSDKKARGNGKATGRKKKCKSS